MRLHTEQIEFPSFNAGGYTRYAYYTCNYIFSLTACIRTILDDNIDKDMHVRPSHAINEDVGMYFACDPITIPSLTCFHSFWQVIPTSLYIFNVFYSCYYYSFRRDDVTQVWEAPRHGSN